MSSKHSIDVVLERLENLKEDMLELKKSVVLLQEDYIKRQSIGRFIIWVASAVSAVASFFVTQVMDKFR